MVSLAHLGILITSKIASSSLESRGDEKIRLARGIDPAFVRKYRTTIRKMDAATADSWDRIAEDQQKVEREGWGYKCAATSVRTVVILGLSLPITAVVSPIACGVVTIIVLTPLIHRVLIWGTLVAETYDPLVTLIHKSALLDRYLCYALIDPYTGLSQAFAVVSVATAIKIITALIKKHPYYHEVRKEVEKFLPARSASYDDLEWLTCKIKEVDQLEGKTRSEIDCFVTVYKNEKEDHLTKKTQAWFDAYCNSLDTRG